MTPEQTLEATFRSGNHGMARKIAVSLLTKNSKNKVALQVLAHIALLSGVSGEALTIATRALEQDDKDPRTNLLLAEIHGARGHTERALSYCDRVLKTHPNDVSATLIGARLLERSGLWEDATQLLQPLIALKPTSPLLALTLGRCWMRAGKYDDALALQDEALEQVKGETPAARQQQCKLKSLKALILDRSGRFDEAWREASEANDLLHIKYDPQTYTDEVDRMIEWFTKERIETMRRAEPTDSSHVFIVGMARSGTTLTEQILDAHSKASGVGELKDLDVLVRMLPRTLNMKMALPDVVEYADETRLAQMVERYEEGIQQQGFETADVYVNKNLRNVFLLGYIAMLFPKAKVIICSRDLRDTGVSSFMAGMNPGLFPHLFNIEHMAASMRDYQRLVAHWQEVLPLELLEVQYEDLVNDQEAQSRRMLEFCDLDWEPACLKFWESDRTVMTLSYDQVTRPMYASSIGRFNNYSEHIKPLLDLVST